MSLKLGTQVKCRVTGFTGTVTRRTESLYGSTQVLVCGFDSGFRRDEWLEEQQCEATAERSLAAVTSIPIRPPAKADE
jgi:hypothetical protein